MSEAIAHRRRRLTMKTAAAMAIAGMTALNHPPALGEEIPTDALQGFWGACNYSCSIENLYCLNSNNYLMYFIDDTANISYFEGSPAYHLVQGRIETDGPDLVVKMGRDAESRMENIEITPDSLRFSTRRDAPTANVTHCRLDARDNPVAAGMLRHLSDAGASESAPRASINPTYPAQPITLLTHIVIPRFTPAPRSRYALVLNDRPFDDIALEVNGTAYLHAISDDLALVLLSADPTERARALRAFGLSE